MTSSNSPLPARLLHHLDVVAKAEGFGEYTIEHEAGSNIGDGFMATMLAVTIIGKTTDVDSPHRGNQLSLICKLKPANATRQENFQTDLVFDREVMMYNVILPALAKFQRDKGIGESNGLSAYPKCYLATNETTSAVIIMENMRASGHVMWDKKQPLKFDNARLLIEQLAAMHGISVAIRDQHPEIFAQWQKLPDIFAEMAKTKAIQRMFTSAYDRAIGLSTDQRHIDIFTALKKDWKPINERCMDENVLGAHSVLIHGDCWNNNMMYKTNVVNSQSVCLVDWQLSRISSPAVDLSYFLFSSTEKKFRDQHLDELIRLYYDRFAEIIQRCGSDPLKLYTFNDLQAQMRSHSVYGVLTAPILISIMVADPEQLVNLDEMDDLQSDDHENHLAILDKRTESKFEQRLVDVVNDAIAYGWLPDYPESTH